MNIWGIILSDISSFHINILSWETRRYTTYVCFGFTYIPAKLRPGYVCTHYLANTWISEAMQEWYRLRQRVCSQQISASHWDAFTHHTLVIDTQRSYFWSVTCTNRLQAKYRPIRQPEFFDRYCTSRDYASLPPSHVICVILSCRSAAPIRCLPPSRWKGEFRACVYSSIRRIGLLIGE